MQYDNGLNKKKADLLKTIMGNKKLSKVFSSALNAPLGSTKRSQAKSIFSIMDKLKSGDGQGGPTISQPSSSQSQPDYSNMVVFPAAPRFKKRQQVPINDGQGGPVDFSGINLVDLGKKKTTPSSISYSGSGDNASYVPGQNEINANKFDYSKLKIGTPQKTDFSGMNIKDVIKPDYIQSTDVDTGFQFKMPKDYSKLNLGEVAFPSLSDSKMKKSSIEPDVVSGDIDVKDGWISKAKGTMTDMTQPAEGTENIPSDTETDQTPVAPTGILEQAKAAVSNHIGAGTFAKGMTDEAFGGSLQAKMTKFDEDLRKNLGIDELSASLTNMQAMSNSFVPTMQNYIQGRDKYLSFINKLIDQTNDELMTTDTSNPEVQASRDLYMNYLYTLKGRQNKRYGDVLNNAVNDFNSDVANINNQYKVVSDLYKTKLTQGYAMTQSEYTNTYNAMADLYSNLDGASLKRANLNKINAENQILGIKLGTLNDATSLTSTDYLKETKDYKHFILDSKGKLLPLDVIGGLAKLYNTIETSKGKDPRGITLLLKQGMAKNLEELNAYPDDQVMLYDKYREALTELSKDPQYGNFAQEIATVFKGGNESPTSKYIEKNFSALKDAIDNLVSGGLIGKSYLEKGDKEKWKEENGDIKPEILDKIWDTTVNAVKRSDEFAKNPEIIFAGNDDELLRTIQSILST